MATTEAQVLNSDNINLQKQDLKNLDVSNLTPLSPEVISRQATINIGTIGHVAHGKSTVVKAISGVQTVRFKNELERNITIKLERISDQRIQALLNNRDLLRDFERLQELKYMTSKTTIRRQTAKKVALSVKVTADLFTKPKSKLKRCATPRRTNRVQSNDYQTILREETPSSGYDSSYEASSIKSSESNTNKYNCFPSYGLANSMKRTEHPKEYVIESIESVESLNGEALFNVKWLGYSSKLNTWEPLDNIKECQQLELFVGHMMKLHQKTILRLQRELNGELRQEKERWTITPNGIAELDKYDPIYLKIYLILWAQFVLTKDNCVTEVREIRRAVLYNLTLEYFHNKRKRQLLSLQKWHNKMNEVEHEAPIRVENSVDLDILDTNFQYINKSFMTEGLTIVNQTLNSCNCRLGCSPSSNCCARRIGNNFAYDKNGYLRLKLGEAIFECNKDCSCPIDCRNRVIQRGRKNSLCLFKTYDGRGWGVRTDKLMLKGEYVAEYVGEIITTEEADERGKRYDANGLTYLFDLDYDTKNTKYTIDAANFGNITHFFNHSCNPNLGVYSFWIDHLNISMQRLAFFTLRHINAGEELTFDYINTEYENFNNAGKIPCRCGAQNCRKILF